MTNRDQSPGLLVIFGGLPGSGKTSIARELARQTGAIHLRIDTIEQAMRDSGRVVDDIYDAGYRVAYALAQDNLRLGLIVIADSVNSLETTRQAWREVAVAISANYLEVESVCSDPEEHRRRVETREGDIATLKQPSWADVQNREYQAWESPDLLVIDTARLSLGVAVERIRARLTMLRPQVNPQV